jgi:hypothetical protein
MTVPPTIALGSTDVATVVAAQRNLNVADAGEQSAGRPGLAACPLIEDGVFGSGVEQAALDFQGRRGLGVDGIIGPNTWGRLLQGVDPDSGVASAAAIPVEGTVRWSVSLDDITASIGTAPTASQLSGVSVAVGGTLAASPAVSPDGRRIYFTPPPLAEGKADLLVTGGDGSPFALVEAVSYTASFPAALAGLGVALALSIQENASAANALRVARMQSFVDGLAASMLAFQDLTAQLLARFQDPATVVSAEDGAAWMGHMATRARMVADIVNEHCRITLATDAIADLDGLPFGGADDLPTLDTGATVLLMTALENVIVPFVVDLTA